MWPQSLYVRIEELEKENEQLRQTIQKYERQEFTPLLKAREEIAELKLAVSVMREFITNELGEKKLESVWRLHQKLMNIAYARNERKKLANVIDVSEE